MLHNCKSRTFLTAIYLRISIIKTFIERVEYFAQRQFGLLLFIETFFCAMKIRMSDVCGKKNCT